MGGLLSRFLRLLAREALTFQMRAQRVVLLELAEARLRPAQRVGGSGRPLTAGVDAGLLGHDPSDHPGVVLPRLGP